MKHVIPKFWSQKTLATWLLWPASILHRVMSDMMVQDKNSYESKVPVICVGNVTVGGAGKTPTVIAITKILQEKGKKVVIVTKGYGGRLKGPLLVDANHTAQDIGDEAILLASAAPTIVGYSRQQAVKEAEKLQADYIIMDDGLQNKTVKKQHSILVVDALFGVGNGFVLPAGPLRETLNKALERVKLVLWIGDRDRHPQLQKKINEKRPIQYAQIKPAKPSKKYNDKYIAFAGIGNPQKFFNTLRDQNITLADTVPFPDHHVYSSEELSDLLQKSKEKGARLITTEKDYVKIAKKYHKHIDVFPVKLELDSDILLRLIGE